MKLICNKQELLHGLNIVSKAVSNKSTLPLLKGILIETINDKQIKLAASDMDLSIEQTVSVEVYEEGKTVAPAKLFIELIRKLPANDVTIETDEEENIKINSFNSSFTLIGMDAAEFPKIGEINKDKVINIDKKTFKKMVSKTTFAASIDESKGVATGVLIEAGKNTINMVAIDGFRMSVAREKVKNVNEADIIVVARILNEINKIMTERNDDEYDEIEIIIDDNKAAIMMDETLTVMRLLDGNFVKYNDILPKEHGTRIKIMKDDLKESIERASLMAKEGKNNLIRMAIIDGSVIITSRSEAGNVKEEIFVEKEGSNLEIGFNSKYVIDALSVIEDDAVYIDFNSGVSPFVIRPTEGNEYDFLILPIRISAAQ